LFFFLVEWGNLYVISAIIVTLFLGGWQIPPVTDNAILRNLLQFVTFFAKSYFFVIVAMWIRATLPRIRVDQLMTTCWKYLVPLGFINLLGTAVWVVLFPEGSPFVEGLMFSLGAGLVGYFFWRVRFHYVRSGHERMLSPFS
jgi:NADH-quinone oxidoreductase subunit H